MTSAIKGVEVGDKARLIRLTAYGLLGAAFLTPFLVAWVGGLNGFDSGRLFGQMAMALLLAAIAVGVAVRGRSVTVQAYGRLLAGAGFLTWAVIASVTAWQDTHAVRQAKDELVTSFMKATVVAAQPEAPTVTSSAPAPSSPIPAPASTSPTDKKVGFIKGAGRLGETLVAKFGALDRKFAAIDLSSMLTPDSLVSADNIAASRAKIRQMGALINERDTVLQRYMTDAETYFKTVDVDEVNRLAAITSFEAGRSNTLKSYASLTEVQTASLKAIGAMLDFAELNLGKTSTKNGQILFTAKDQLDQYNALLSKIQSANMREQEASKRMAELQQQSRQSLVNTLGK